MSHGTGPWPPVDPYTGQLPQGTFSSRPPPPPPQDHSWRPSSFPHWQFTLMLEVSSKSCVLQDLTPQDLCVVRVLSRITFYPSETQKWLQ